MDPIRFCERLDPEWQAELIAAYLLDMQIEAVLATDNAKKQSDQSQGQGQGNQGRNRERGKPNPAQPRRTDRIRDGGTWE